MPHVHSPIVGHSQLIPHWMIFLARTRAGRARTLSGDDAQRGNTALRRRYGWQWNIVPLLKIPGVTNVHSDLPLREKLRRARHRGLWPDSAIIAVDL